MLGFHITYIRIIPNFPVFHPPPSNLTSVSSSQFSHFWHMIGICSVLSRTPRGYIPPRPGKHPLTVSRIPLRGYSCYLQRSPRPLAVMDWDQDLMTPSLVQPTPPGPKSWINAWVYVQKIAPVGICPI